MSLLNIFSPHVHPLSENPLTPPTPTINYSSTCTTRRNKVSLAIRCTKIFSRANTQLWKGPARYHRQSPLWVLQLWNTTKTINNFVPSLASFFSGTSKIASIKSQNNTLQSSNISPSVSSQLKQLETNASPNKGIAITHYATSPFQMMRSR